MILENVKQEKKYLHKIPRQLTKQQLDEYVLEYLILGKRGFAIQIPILAILNAILYVINSGCQWYSIEGLKFDGYEVKYKTIYYHFNRWSKLGCFKKMFESSQLIPENINILDSTYIESSLDNDDSAYSGYKHKNSTKFHCFSSLDNKILGLVNFSSGNFNDINDICAFEEFLVKIQPKSIENKVYLLADSGYDCINFKLLCIKYNLIPIIAINNRNRKEKLVMSENDKKTYKVRYCIEKLFAWLKSFRGIKIRYDIKASTWNAKLYLSSFLINMKNVF